MKKDKIDQPEVYLGERLANNSLNGQDIWTMSSVDYTKMIIKNIEIRLKKEGRTLPERSETPMSSDYKPELDATSELDTDGITMYQELTRELKWANKIGRFDILHEVSVLSSYQNIPRNVNLQKILHIFAFFKKN